MYKFIFTLFFALLLLSSCGSDANYNNGPQPFLLEEKKFLHNLFLTQYLWYDQVSPQIDYDQFSSPQEMINALKVSPPDHWSFMFTKQKYEDFTNQKTAGFGFGYKRDYQIFLVRIDSPAYGKLQRGDRILQINDKEVDDTLISKVSKNLNTPATFTVLRDSNTLNVTVTPKEYTFKVSLGKIITQGVKKIGYLRCDSFTGSSVVEFENIFNNFHNENIDELVIDLRYNGGGSLSATSALIDNITNAHAGEKQIYLDWNYNYKNKNQSYNFEELDEQDGNELNMKRVIFLVTKNSASASEALISSLKPHLGNSNIVTIGSETGGKPVGMAGRTYGDNYYFLINFYVRNSADETTSFNGIPVTCPVKDDIDHVMGDENEKMFATALYFIDNNQCPEI